MDIFKILDLYFYYYCSIHLRKKNAFTPPNTFTSYTENSLTYSDNTKYIGYIQESKYKGNVYKYEYCSCQMKKDAIIIYGKQGKNIIIFTYANGLKANYAILIDYCTKIEDKIKCRKILNSIIPVMLHEIEGINTTTNCEFFKRLKVSFGPFKAHIEIEIFKTADTKNIL